MFVTLSRKMGPQLIAPMFFSLVLATLPALADQSVSTELQRTIVAPAVVTTPEQARNSVYPMFKGPGGQFVLSVRWQGLDIVSTPNDYEASAETTFRPPDPLTNWQFGPDKAGRRSTYQIYGSKVGFLSITADSVLPKNAPPAADRHASYSYRLLAPRPVFQDAQPWALMVEAKVTVPKFIPFHNVTVAQGVLREPMGSFYFVVSFADRTNPSIRQVPISVLMFNSRGDLRRERIFVDPSNNLTTATSWLSARRDRMLYTSLSKASAVVTGTPFSDERLFRFYITPENFRNMIAAMNAKGARLSNDLRDYSLLRFGIVQEQAQPEGDHSEMASTIADFGIYEVAPAIYANDIRK